MANQVLINFRIDKDVKIQMEELCKKLGINMSTAFSIFANKMVNEQRIPFEVSIDPFYSKANIEYLENVKKELEKGKAKKVKHNLIEV